MIACREGKLRSSVASFCRSGGGGGVEIQKMLTLPQERPKSEKVDLS